MTKKEDIEEINNYDQSNYICEESNKSDESVLQNLILSGFKLCNSCRVSKTIFPI